MVLRAGHGRFGSRVCSRRQMFRAPHPKRVCSSRMSAATAAGVWCGHERGAPTPIEQPGGALLAVAREPFVADAAETEFGHRPETTLEILSKMLAFAHGIGLLPGHHFSSPRGQEQCQPCARTAVTYVPGLYQRAA